MNEQKSRVRMAVVGRFIRTYEALVEHFEGVLDVSAVARKGTVKDRLKSAQIIASLTHAINEWAASTLNLGNAAEQQYWLEIERLIKAGYCTALGERDPSNIELRDRPELVMLAKKISRYFTRATYVAGKSQRHVLPIFTQIHWKSQATLLANALTLHRKKGPRIRIVEDSDESKDSKVILVVDPSFDRAIEFSQAASASARPLGSMYVLCGVHGGRETHDHRVEESVTYFEETDRLPLSLREAFTLFTLHPDFLVGKNDHIILLGEHFEGKYASMVYDEERLTLSLKFISGEEVDRGHIAPNPAPHQYHGSPDFPTYGMPSAGDTIEL